MTIIQGETETLADMQSEKLYTVAFSLQFHCSYIYCSYYMHFYFIFYIEQP